MNPDTKNTQVLIVGGGPVGMGLAVELGQRGVRCTVVERHAEPQRIPKGQNLTQRTMEHFFFWGAEKELRAARTIPKEYGAGGLTAYGTLLSGYHYDWMQRALVRPFYFTDNERLPQYCTEAVLRRRVAELPSVEVLYGWRAEQVGQDVDRASVVIAPHAGGAARTVRADYLVGCDGSRSVVRESAGIGQVLSDHDRLMFLLVFRSRGLHALVERFANKSFFSVLHPALDGYWQFFGRVDLGTTWFFHAPVPAGTAATGMDFRPLLYAAAGAEFDVEIEHIGFWEMRFATAETYLKGRVFVAGDAAHSHPPYGGYGINTGFEDVTNLGWKLWAALQGWAGDRLLETYDEERRPVFASTARDFIEKAIEDDRSFLRAFDPARDKPSFEREWHARGNAAPSEVNAFEPHYEGSSIVLGPAGGRCGAVGSHQFAARAGHHLAPAALSSGRNVYEALGKGFTLLALRPQSPVPAAFEQTARNMNVPLSIVVDSREGERARYEAGHVLVRPDQFVAWASDDDQVDPRAILRRAIAGDRSSVP